MPIIDQSTLKKQSIETQRRKTGTEANDSSYLDTIFRISSRHLAKQFTKEEISYLYEKSSVLISGSRREIIDGFVKIYREFVKQQYQDTTEYSAKLDEILNDAPSQIKLLWGNCFTILRSMKSESVQLMVTSPPYYNARAYSQWKNIDEYLSDMRSILTECYRVLDNHRVFVFNVGDIYGNDNTNTTSTWGKRRIPLGTYFTQIFEDIGFQFVDDFIWDKGEVQSMRHKSGDRPYPLYQYPVNCYEHIFVFYKHRLDTTLYPCPVCGCLRVNGNAYSGVGIKSWECKNYECFERSSGNRGKRFSSRTYLMDQLQTEENRIDPQLLSQWRRDIVKFPPVIKINSRGENVDGHTAPFPREIPAYAIEVFTGRSEHVFDPFAGSFTTAIEAVKNGRIGYGAELNKGIFRSAILEKIRRSFPTQYENLNPTEVDFDYQ